MRNRNGYVANLGCSVGCLPETQEHFGSMKDAWAFIREFLAEEEDENGRRIRNIPRSGIGSIGVRGGYAEVIPCEEPYVEQD